jgi:heat shock protein HslJ
MPMPAGTAGNTKGVPTLRFEAGRASGSDGCNRFSAPYTGSPGKLQCAAPRVGTTMACPSADSAAMARLFDAALNATRTYRIDAGDLLLLDAAGAELLRLGAQANGMAGTSWRVGGNNHAQQAVVCVIDATTLTLAFGSDAQVSGLGGCNGFTGSYRAVGDKLSIGPLAATRKACAAPEGAMAQQAALLRALQTAATARREGRRMELRTASGALAATVQLGNAARP